MTMKTDEFLEHIRDLLAFDDDSGENELAANIDHVRGLITEHLADS